MCARKMAWTQTEKAFRVTPAVTKVDSLLRASGRAEKWLRVLGTFYDKNQDFLNLTLTISMKVVPDEVKMSRIMKARGPGKFYSLRTRSFKVGVNVLHSREFLLDR